MELQNDLTEEEKTLLEIDTRKKKYKLLTNYLESKECESLIAKYIVKWEEILKLIELELDKRRKWDRSKASVSDLDKTLSFYDFQLELANDLWNSEAELILKEDLINSADNTKTHLTNKIEELYDVPSYSELDLLKTNRVEYALIKDKLELMTSLYLDRPNVVPNLNPYEEDTEQAKEFDLLTNVD